VPGSSRHRVSLPLKKWCFKFSTQNKVFISVISGKAAKVVRAFFILNTNPTETREVSETKLRTEPISIRAHACTLRDVGSPIDLPVHDVVSEEAGNDEGNALPRFVDGQHDDDDGGDGTPGQNDDHCAKEVTARLVWSVGDKAARKGARCSEVPLPKNPAERRWLI
jgi:hypothetical protein